MGIILRDDKYVEDTQAQYLASDGDWVFFQAYDNDDDWNMSLYCYRIVGGSLIYKWMRTFVSLGFVVDEYPERMIFDGTYLAICGGRDGLFIFTVDDAGLTLVDSHYDSTSIGGNSSYEYVVKIGDTWHVTCGSGGIKAYRLITGTLTLVGYQPIHESANRARAITNSADGTYIYVYETPWYGTVDPNIYIYTYNGSSYTNIGQSDGIYSNTSWTGACTIGQEVFFGGVPSGEGYGSRHFHHNTDTHILEHLGSIGAGHYVDNVHYDGTFIHMGTQDGLFLYDPLSYVELFAEDSGDWLYYDNWGDGHWILSTYDNWEVEPTLHGVVLYENEQVAGVEFEGIPDEGLAPLTVQFVDRTVGIVGTSWLWDFGDGNTSTLQNPKHTYLYPGIYTVTLTINDTESLTKDSYIGVYEALEGDMLFNFDSVKGFGDIFIECADLKRDPGFETAVFISLFTDKRADDSDKLPNNQVDKRGWWSDNNIGSKLWLIEREKLLNEAKTKAEQYSKEALQWLVDEGIAETILTEATLVRGETALTLSIRIIQKSGEPIYFKYYYNWEAQIARRA